MSKKHDTVGGLDDRSLVEFTELIRKRGLLDTLVKRAPVFSNFRLGGYFNLPTTPGCPAPEIGPGLGSAGFTLKLGFKAGEFRKYAKREGVGSVFAEFFSAKYFDQVQRRYGSALSLEANRIGLRLQRRLASRLPRTDYESIIADLYQQMRDDLV